MNHPGWANALMMAILFSALIVLAACGASPPEFSLNYACLHRSLPPCSAAEKFADRIADRTDGRVKIEITNLTDLGLPDFEVLPRLEDGTLDMVDIRAANFVKEDRAVLNMLDLWGLYRDHETQMRVTETIRKEIEGKITERSGGVALGVQFYPSNYFFTKEPLRTAADIRGLRVRGHNELLVDLLAGMGAIAKDVSFGNVYLQLETDRLDAAVSCSSCSTALRWNIVADYVVGPIPALGHSWMTINSQRWSELPPDIQLIIREEATRHEAVTKASSLDRWDRIGIQQNIAEGMEHIELTPELKDLMRTATLTTVLPSWVREAGGPNSDVIALFNQKVAPIVKVEITGEGTAKEVR